MRMTMSEQWYNISFDYKIGALDMDWEDVDKRKLLLGLGRAVAYLTLDPEMEENMRMSLGILVKDLEIYETEFLDDVDIQNFFNDPT
jgi:hypothetical protein